MHADGSAAATAAAVSEATAARMASIAETKLRLEQGPARDILSSITLVWACMEALPRIVTGVTCALHDGPRERVSRVHLLCAPATAGTSMVTLASSCFVVKAKRPPQIRSDAWQAR